jgi:hypothetical protein
LKGRPFKTKSSAVGLQARAFKTRSLAERLESRPFFQGKADQKNPDQDKPGKIAS